MGDVGENKSESPTTEASVAEKTILVVTSAPDPDQQEAMLEYVRGVMPLLLERGGVVVKRSRIAHIYHGEKPFTFLLIMDFPSQQSLMDLFESDAYQALIPARDRGFKKIDILFAHDLK